MSAQHIKSRLAGQSSCVPMGTGARHMWRLLGRGRFGPVYVFKCYGCEMTTATSVRRFWGKR